MIRNNKLYGEMLVVFTVIVVGYAIIQWIYADYIRSGYRVIGGGLGMFVYSLITRKQAGGYDWVKTDLGTLASVPRVDTVPYVCTTMVVGLCIMLILTPSLPAFFAWGTATCGVMSIAWRGATYELKKDSAQLTIFGIVTFFVLVTPYWMSLSN